MAPKAAPKGCKAGHPGCDCKLSCCTITAKRKAEIKAEVEASRGKNWASEVGYGPACVCGMRPQLVGAELVKRKCYRHDN